MPVLGVTGGVATGKSTFTRVLKNRLSAAVFDADAVVRQLTGSNPVVRQAIADAFGPQVFTADSAVNRAWLRQQVFDDEKKRRILEAILHPPVREAWRAAAAQARCQNQWLIVDIPLLFETRSQDDCDAVVVVAASRQTQLERLQRDRGIPPEIGGRIIDAQLDLTLKMNQADYVIWNESSRDHLEQQARLLAEHLKKRYG